MYDTNQNDCSVIYIGSHKLVNDACKILKLKPGPKDYFTSLPKFENDFLTWSFIRGYFEGDGTIVKTLKNRFGQINVLSSENFLISLKIILDKLGVGSRIISCGKIFKLYICGLDDMMRFSHFIYKDADFSLPRKRLIFEELERERFKPIRCNKTSKYLGVSLDKRTGRFTARTHVDGVRCHVGIYPTQEDANLARIQYLRDRSKYVEGILA